MLPDAPPKPARSGTNGQTNTAPLRKLPPLQRIIERAQERRAVKQWNVSYGPTETLERFYVDGSQDVGTCLIRETPDSRHAVVYVTCHPLENHGLPTAFCVTCQARDCAGCVWGLKAFRAAQRANMDVGYRDDLPF